MQSYQVILRPLLTEKSAWLKDKANQYVFAVHPEANKKEIGKAVEELFKVKVKKVHTLNVLGKLRRMGRFFGYRSSWKKAVVTVHKGQKIDLAEGL